MARGKKNETILTREERLQQALVPEVEWPYKVPENWRWTRLSYLLSTSKEKTEDFSDKEVKYIGLENIEKDYGIVSYNSSEGIKSQKSVFLEGQILYGKLRPYLNKHDIAPFSGICSTDILVFDTKETTSNQFVNYFLSLQSFIEYAVANSKGINLPRVSESVVLEALCPLPPLPEQQRIVDHIESLFAKLDEAKEKAQAVVDGFEDRKAAILHKAFTGELTEGWRTHNNISIKSWERKRLADTSIKIIDGDRGKNYPKKEEFSPEGYCVFLNAKNVTRQGFVFDEIEFITKEKDAILHNGRLERGDMVMTTRGTIGNVAFYDNTVPYEHLRINSGMVIYRGGSEFNKHYLMWLYQSKQIIDQINRLRTGTAQPQLPIKVMNALILPIPLIIEQDRIVGILNELISKEQQAKESAEQVITQIDTMKKSILARAFRGELGTNDPSDESADELLKKIL